MKSVFFLVPVLIAGSALAADPGRDKVLAGYAAQAAKDESGFTGFSAARGETFFRTRHAGGKPDTPSCTTCHTDNPKATGKHYKTGRAIEPVAVSVNPKRFTDPDEVEQRFERDCKNVLGRLCTAREKGDYVTFMASQ